MWAVEDGKGDVEREETRCPEKGDVGSEAPVDQVLPGSGDLLPAPGSAMLLTQHKPPQVTGRKVTAREEAPPAPGSAMLQTPQKPPNPKGTGREVKGPGRPTARDAPCGAISKRLRGKQLVRPA